MNINTKLVLTSRWIKYTFQREAVIEVTKNEIHKYLIHLNLCEIKIYS